jgi:hypothetical protein
MRSAVVEQGRHNYCAVSLITLRHSHAGSVSGAYCVCVASFKCSSHNHACRCLITATYCSIALVFAIMLLQFASESKQLQEASTMYDDLIVKIFSKIPWLSNFRLLLQQAAVCFKHSPLHTH